MNSRSNIGTMHVFTLFHMQGITVNSRACAGYHLVLLEVTKSSRRFMYGGIQNAMTVKIPDNPYRRAVK